MVRGKKNEMKKGNARTYRIKGREEDLSKNTGRDGRTAETRRKI